MMKIQMQPKKHEAAKHVLTTMLCMLAVLMVAFVPVTSALAIIQMETPEIVNTFVLGELGYKLVFDANKPATAPTDAQVSNMPPPAENPTKYETEVASATHTFTVDEIPTLTGYQFMGWALNDNVAEADYPVTGEGAAAYCDVPVDYKEDGQQYNTETATTTKTVYAVWKQMDFVLSFDTQTDGEVANPADQTITYQMPYGTLPELTRTGYTLLGWTFTAGEATDFVSADDIVNRAENHTLYAQWGAKSYIIRYNVNGGEGTMENQIIKYNELTPLTKNTFTKADYTFAGWAETPDATEPKYLDEHLVVNLLEEGTIDLYAVWVQNSHTVTFDYNGGTGSPDSKQVLNGNPYGTLPEYPVHPQKVIAENEIMSYLFTGWYTARDGGTRVYPSTMVNRTDDHTLYAHWKEAPTNNVIKELTVKNNPDDNKDGVIDSFNVTLKCSSSFEKLNIPLENLVVGQRYKLSFNESNDATYGMNESGYGGAIYGFIITKEKTLTPGTIKDESIADGGLIKQFSDRYDGQLNGPRSWETTFTAEAGTMYWTWDYGLILDGHLREYNYTNIKLEIVPPTIEFDNKDLIIYQTSQAQILNDTSSDYSTNFEFDGDGYAETMYYPITGLMEGMQYTITFDHKFTGKLIHDSVTHANPSYHYGCGIMNVKPEKYGSYMNNIGTYAAETFVMPSVTGNTESVTFTFTAASETAYWVWNLANVSDSNNCIIDVKVTKFTGGGYTYYDASSAATLTATLLNPEDMPTVAVSNNLPNVTITGMDSIAANQPAVLTLTGSDIPDVLNVEVTGTQTTEPTVSTFALRSVEPVAGPAADEAQTVTTTLYMTGLNEALVNASAVAEGATAQAWITANADGSQTLILPAELMTEGATITITGASYNSYNLSEITYEHLN